MTSFSQNTRIVIRLASYDEIVIEGICHRPPNYEWLQWFVAECDGEIIGRSSVHVNGRTAWLNHAIVSEEYRGHGIYTVMVEKRLAYAQEHGASVAVAYCNSNSAPTIMKAGFHEQGLYDKRGRSLLYMVKELH